MAFFCYNDRMMLVHAAVELLVPSAQAFSLDLRGIVALCGDSLPCAGLWGGGAAGAAVYIAGKLVWALKIVFLAAALLMAFLSAVSLVLSPMDETVVKESRTSFTYIIVGAAFVIVSDLISQTFVAGSGLLVNPVPFIGGVQGRIIPFILGVTGILLVVNVVVQAMRIITSQGEQAQIDKARKRLIAGFVGVAFIILSGHITGAADPGTGGVNQITDQIIGIAQFMLFLLGGGALITMIVSGIVLVFSVEEGLKDKAKNIIKVSVVAIVAVVCAHPILALFIPA